MLHSSSSLMNSARLEYKESTLCAVDHKDENLESTNTTIHRADHTEDGGSEAGDNNSVTSIFSVTKNDLSVLGVDIDEATIERLQSNLGMSLFNTATKAAQTLRVSKNFRDDAAAVATPMGGHLLDDSFMNFANGINNEISMVSNATPALHPRGSTSSSNSNRPPLSSTVPKSMTMSTSFNENPDNFLPLASGADLETSILSIEEDVVGEGSEHLNRSSSNLYGDYRDEMGAPMLEREEESEIESEKGGEGPSMSFLNQSAHTRGGADTVNTSLDYYRKKRGIYKVDLNDIIGDNDVENIGDAKADHTYIQDINANAAFSLEPAMRGEVDRFLVALQMDYMKTPDKFTRRLFGFPTNTPKASMKVIMQLRYVGETAFFDAMRRVLRAKDGAKEESRSDAAVKVENELIWSVYQLCVELRHLPGEADQRPVVDLWEFIRKFKTGDRLRGMHRVTTKDEFEEQTIRSNFHKLDKTNDPIPQAPYRVNALDREVRASNAEIEKERAREVMSTAWRNRSPPRRAFEHKDMSVFGFRSRPSDGTMLQVLNHDVSKQSRAIDDSQPHSRAFGGVEFLKAKGDTDIIGSVLRQEKESTKARDAHERRVYYNRTNNKARPEAKAVEELLRTADSRFEGTSSSITKQDILLSTDGTQLTKRSSRANVIHKNWTSSSVSAALHGNYDTSHAVSGPRGMHISDKALSIANESNERTMQREKVDARIRKMGTVTNVGPAPTTLHVVRNQESSVKRDMFSALRDER